MFYSTSGEHYIRLKQFSMHDAKARARAPEAYHQYVEDAASPQATKFAAKYPFGAQARFSPFRNAGRF
ncbi:MAG: hypothetical protein C0399_08445 [Syntrophus sp. (in: bacteria)]|nr:hypothetical protein [Syntrophus sp. (in: bacteria)]